MALLTPTPPGECITAFQQGLQTLIGGQISRKNYVGAPPSIPSPADLGFVAETAPQGHDAQQVFTLALADVTNPAGTGAARQSGWRIFAGTAQGKMVYGHVTQDPAGWKLTSMYYGDQVWEAWQECLKLGSLPAVQAADHELRILAIPGLHIEVSWLVAQQPGLGDLAVPFQFEQAIPGLDGSGAIAMGSFLSTLVARFQQLLPSLGSEPS